MEEFLYLKFGRGERIDYGLLGSGFLLRSTSCLHAVVPFALRAARQKGENQGGFSSTSIG
jgi:hypothetical protein